MLKSKKGITLIALVITMVILLILAAVTLTSVVGKNGLVNKAKKTKEKMTEKSVVEYVSLKIEGGDEKHSILERLESVEDLEIFDTGSDLYYVTKEGFTISVYEDGRVIEGIIDVWDGAKMEAPEFDKEFNWYIYNCAQLKFLADFVNNGNILTEKQNELIVAEGYSSENITIDAETIVYLMNDLDLGARFENGTLTKGTQWTPIGGTDGAMFSGTFEGNGHYIDGLFISSEASLQGLFGEANEVNNLTVKNSYVKGVGQVGAIAGVIYNANNVHNENTTIEGLAFVGGIAGQGIKRIEKCINTGTVIGSRDAGYIGGIIGATTMSGTGNTELVSCINRGKVYGSFSIIGGIVGMSVCGTITDCYNFGTIGDSESMVVGGIVADLRTNISGCVNNGVVIGTVQIGGIVSALSTGNVENCTNMGSVTSYDDRAGGIIGSINVNTTTPITVSKCVNTGNVETIGDGFAYTGGILGIISTDSKDPSTVPITTISACYNTGKIKGYQSVAGIAGGVTQYGSIVEKSYNRGSVEGHINVAGITGQLGRGSKVIDCYNAKEIAGVERVAGIVGYTYNSACQVANSYNTGMITGSSVVGGIIGLNANTSIISNTYYLIDTASLNEGNGTTSDLAKDENYIKTTFVTNANTPVVNWEIRSNENNGYPVLNCEFGNKK